MCALLYANDTLLLSETEEDMQRARGATLKFRNEIKMTINVSRAKGKICSRGKLFKISNLFLKLTAIERADTFATSELCSPTTTPSKLQ